MEQIIPPVDKELLISELTPDKRLRMTNKSHNHIYVVDIHDSPNVVREIGRQREEVFRAAGGGTGKALDLDEFYYRMLDLRIAGIHLLCWQGGTIEENTDGMIAAIRNPWTQIISHPGDGTAELLFEPIVLAAKETGTLLEINNSSLNPQRKKGTARANNLEILRLCKRYDVPVILSSDAHISYSIADYSFIWPLLQETEFPDQLIMNYDTERFLEYISRKGGTQ